MDSEVKHYSSGQKNMQKNIVNNPIEYLAHILRLNKLKKWQKLFKAQFLDLSKKNLPANNANDTNKTNDIDDLIDTDDTDYSDATDDM